MRDSKNIGADLTAFRMQAALSEYQALRAELIQKFTHQMQLYSLVVGTVTIMLGYALANRAYDLLLAIPIVSSALAFRFIWEQAIVTLLGKYLATVEEDVLPTIIGQREKDFDLGDRKYWIGWEGIVRLTGEDVIRGSCCILHECAPPFLFTIVIASLARLLVIAFGCISASP